MQLRVLLAAAAILAAASASAQDIEISCEGSPPDAVRNVPQPAARFVHVLCTKYGHVLAPVAGWFWTSPGTYAPHFYPAQMVRESPKETGNAVYFKAITSTPLTGEGAAQAWQVLAEVFPHEPAPTKALRIVAESSAGSSHTVYIFPSSWGYSCSPVCHKDSAFIMVSQAKEHPSW